MRKLPYRPMPFVKKAFEDAINIYYGFDANRYKIVVDNDNYSVLFKFPFNVDDMFKSFLEEARPLGITFKYKKLGFFESRFNKRQWIEK